MNCECELYKPDRPKSNKKTSRRKSSSQRINFRSSESKNLAAAR